MHRHHGTRFELHPVWPQHPRNRDVFVTTLNHRRLRTTGRFRSFGMPFLSKSPHRSASHGPAAWIRTTTVDSREALPAAGIHQQLLEITGFLVDPAGVEPASQEASEDWNYAHRHLKLGPAPDDGNRMRVYIITVRHGPQGNRRGNL